MLPCIYKWVKGYEGLYIVNNYGSVISLCRKKPKMLKTVSDKNGYIHISLHKKGSPTKYMDIHALVGNAFIGERIDDLTFDHIDRDRQNNRADNLRLATRSEQSLNQGIRKNNKLGEKNISIVVHSGKEYYRIHIERNKKNIVNRCFNKNKYTLEEVVEERDKELLKLKD